MGKSSTTSSFIIGDVVLEKGNRDDDLCTYEKLSLCNKNVFEENDEDEDDELEEQDEQEEQEEENSSAPLKMDETSASAIDGKKKESDNNDYDYENIEDETAIGFNDLQVHYYGDQST